MARDWAVGIVDDKTRQLMGTILDAGFDLHRELGPGYLESVYRRFLAHLLRQQGHEVREEVWLGVEHLGLRIERAFRVDLLVDGLIVVEVKAVETFHEVHRAQVISYLKASGLPAGVLMNFNVPYFKQGYDRLVHPKLLRKKTEEK